MKGLKSRIAKGEVVIGSVLNLGSSLTAEIVGRAGFDWVLIDLEHGAGDEHSTLYQLQALEHTSATAIVRVESGMRQRIHRILDIGAEGVMIPRIDTAQEAADAISGMRYPPDGVRGVASMNRACSYGVNFKSYVAEANSVLLTVIQIETEKSVSNVDAIAATSGADVLFVGPSDLTHSMGILGQIDHPRFQEAVRRVAEAAKKHKKAAGIMLVRPEDTKAYVDLGYTFLCSNSDGGMLNSSARSLVATLKQQLSNKTS